MAKFAAIFLALIVLFTLKAIANGNFVLQFVTEPQRSIIVPEGTNATLLCSAKSLLQPVTYKWLLYDKELQIRIGGKYAWQGYHGNLIVTNLRRHDGSMYRCVARNPVGSILSTVGILQAAYFDVQNYSHTKLLTFDVYQSFRLPPPTVMSFPPATVTWSRSTGPIRDGDRGRLFITPEGVLFVLAADRSDAVIHRCTAINPLTEQSTTVVYHIVILAITVTRAMFIIKPPGNKLVVAGHDKKLTLQCIVSWPVTQGIRDTCPIVPTITWHKGSLFLSPASNPSKYGYLQNSSTIATKLIIYNPAKNDEGSYVCHVTDGTWTLAAQAYVTVTKFEDSIPEFYSTLPTTIVGFQGHNAEINCPASKEASSFKWYKNAVRLTARDRISVANNGSLLLRDAVRSDTGLYQVFATNVLGETSLPPVYLIITDIPFATTTAEPSNPTNISSPSPEPPTNNNTTSTTQIPVYYTTEDKDITTENTLGSTKEADIPGLNKGTERSGRLDRQEGGTDAGRSEIKAEETSNGWKAVALVSLALLCLVGLGIGLLAYYKRTEVRRLLQSPRRRFETATSTFELTAESPRDCKIEFQLDGNPLYGGHTNANRQKDTECEVKHDNPLYDGTSPPTSEIWKTENALYESANAERSRNRDTVIVNNIYESLELNWSTQKSPGNDNPALEPE